MRDSAHVLGLSAGLDPYHRFSLDCSLELDAHRLSDSESMIEATRENENDKEQTDVRGIDAIYISFKGESQCCCRGRCAAHLSCRAEIAVAYREMLHIETCEVDNS